MTRFACFIIDRLDSFYIAFAAAVILCHCSGCTPFINAVDSFHAPATEWHETFPKQDGTDQH